MFSGIIEQVGSVKKFEDRGDKKLIIQTSFLKKNLKIGSSVCCNGVCLTVHTMKQNKKLLDLKLELNTGLNEFISILALNELFVKSKTVIKNEQLIFSKSL